ncbi:MAG: LysM peptidoglycan-binding domain-containing protein [Peptostreptococcaceae bacterium]|nr:LysM peptidoglycan-binding domain-containing protein [Peptostreptococcaceae bacterium]
MKKHYKIIAPVRFVIFVTIIFVLIATLTIHMFGLDNASGTTKTYYKQIEVTYGDTLWDIADRTMPADMDPRQAVYEISNLNDIDDGQIYPGQILIVPTEIDENV